MMSDNEDDMAVNRRSRRTKRAIKKQMISKETAVDVITQNRELNLSEDESSDEELKVNVVSNEQTLPASNIPVSVDTETTAYDFSGIIKLQADLIEARERFNSCVANYDEHEEQLSSGTVKNTGSSLDQCSVEELLQIGEGDITEHENPAKSDSYEEATTQSVEITLPYSYEDKELRRQRNKELALTKHLNQVRNERQKDLHKVHLLCLIAHGNYVSSIINSDILYGRALSFLPAEYSPPSLVTVPYIQRLLKWFGNTFPQKKHKKTSALNIDKLEEVFTNLKPCSVRDSVIIFVSLLRGLSLTARIVINLNPLPLKVKKIGWVPSDGSPKISAKSNVQQSTLKVKKVSKSKAVKVENPTLEPSSLCLPGPSRMETSYIKETSLEQPGPSTSRGNIRRTSEQPGPSTSKGNRRTSEQPGPSTSKGNIRRTSKKPVLCDAGSSTSKTSMEYTTTEFISVPGPSTRMTCLQPVSSKPGPSRCNKLSGTDSELELLPVKGKRRSTGCNVSQEDLTCARVIGSKGKQRDPDYELNINSSSSSDNDQAEEPETSVKCGIDYWAEVFIESEERWVAVDLFSHKVDCLREIANRCTQPISYIVGWKNDGSLKDVTRRYAVTWLTKKYRIEHQWWAKTLLPFLSKNYELDIMEDDQLNELMENAPMPVTINEYKNHPLYVLPRHLLKYEALYPKDAVPLGYIKGEPIFSRFCVQVLCSPEKWLREGKSVKLGEEPYKVVTSRSKSDKAGICIETGFKTLELYGSWQVEDYISLPAVDGIVPKNKYGNVELYKQSMLPEGTIHLQIPDLLKIARKLSIDCAPAVVGWQHHSGVSHPVFDGVVVCKEYADLLLDAWNADVDQTEKRFLLQRKLKARKNWLKFCKNVLIKEHLKKKYNFGKDESKDDEPLPKLPKK